MARLSTRSLVPELRAFSVGKVKYRTIFHNELQRRGWSRMLGAAVSGMTESVIWLGMRL